MSFHAFYNQNCGDILMARLCDKNTSSFETIGDVTVLKDSKDEIIGFNIDHATHHFGKLDDGLVQLSEAFMNSVNHLLTASGLDAVSYDLECKFVVGKIIEFSDHPDSDHLHICLVDLGNETTQIVCGAQNARLGLTVVVATNGAIMPSGMMIKPSKLRKVDSNGMLCSAREVKMLNHGFNETGIIELDDAKYQVGQKFII